MQSITFILVYPIVKLLSKLPLRILYILSDVLYLLIFHVFKYRKKVVLSNLNLAFPNNSFKENKHYSKFFFKHFTDLFIETIKAISISKSEIVKRYQYTNPELVNNLLKEGKSIIFIGAHQANWEWSVNSPLVVNSKVYGAYTSLGNTYFDKVVKRSRERFGFKCYESSKTTKVILKNFKEKKQSIYLLLSDQSPQVERSLYWTDFFGIKVPIHVGAETIAKKFDLAVVFCETKKIKRGFYETDFKLITKNPKEIENYRITDEYIKLTEELVKKQPECYLWSHKRFKHKDRFNEWKSMKNVQKKLKK